MTCDEFDILCNAWLDARAAGPLELERAREAHAADCARCRSIARKYEVLRHALAAWGPPPAPAPEFVARVLHAHAATAARPQAWVARGGVMARLGIAAAVLMGIGLAVRIASTTREPARLAPPSVARPTAAARTLSAALADATSATWDLARETSAPAARLGRRVIATASFPGSGELALPISVSPASDVFQSFGDGVNRGVRPLSGSARHAFGFLIGPALGEKPAPAPKERDA